jgi:alpha-galactosidase
VLIEWDEAARQFHLRNDRISYLLRIHENGAPGGLYFGPALAAGRSYRHLPPGEFLGFSNRVGEPIPLEMPTPGSGDFRIPALVVEGADGSSVLALAYREHRILAGKPPIPGLPATYTESDDEAKTLELLLADEPSGLEVRLQYTIFRDLPAIARSARIRNGGRARARLTTAMSASLDLPDADWELVQLSGAWARECQVRTRRLVAGRQSVGSTRGASSHHHNPFIVLRRPATTEAEGEAIGLSLVYSGNFLAEAEVDPYETARVRIGINPDGFGWALEPGEEFATPEAVLVHSDRGLGALSDAYHDLYRDRLARGAWRDRPRPVLINNWEGTYFDFTEDRLVAIAEVARDLGIELFVLDDGWFGARDDDTTSLGDWVVDRRKLPNGIDGLARRIVDLGLQFGLWIEPEMVSARSNLFEAHPDWAIGVPGRPRTESRQQLVLDMSRPEVVDHLFEALSAVLASAPISYVKWDMNRNITEPWSAGLPADRQGELFHRYILGVYELYRRLTEAFPDILFESCAGGGGRFDPGMLAFAPQAWTSDNTDAVERLSIQWGTSLAYPLSSMSAHVSAVPNHQVGRITPLATRAAVAFFGVFGYELDATALTAEERRDVADQVAFYKRHREVFQRGRFVRLHGPFDGDGNETAWLAVSPDARRAVVGWYQVLNRPAPGPGRLRLRGLDPSAVYRVSTWPDRDDGLARANSGERGGDELMAAGLFLGLDRREAASMGDFAARLFVLEAVRG